MLRGAVTTVSAAASAAAAPALPSVTLAGVRLHAIDEAQCIAHVLGELAAGRGGVVVTANLDHVRRLQQPGPFRDVYAAADVVTVDGMPVVWACRIQGTPVKGRVAGSDLMRSLPAAAAAAGRSVYLLGGDPGAGEAAAAALRAASPALRVAGVECPPFGFEKDAAYTTALRARLQAAAPDVVFIALGSPKQEFVIRDLRAALPAAWWLGVGISFSFVAGDVQRAPRWLQRLGLEWLHRLVQEPRRLARRYLVDGLPFAAALFARALWTRLRGAGRSS
jgi:N-acetylglucosaminyldiphosphoundecaprenol N-acetyl-beta-D-mannosaminyltransferase